MVDSFGSLQAYIRARERVKSRKKELVIILQSVSKSALSAGCMCKYSEIILESVRKLHRSNNYRKHDKQQY